MPVTGAIMLTDQSSPSPVTGTLSSRQTVIRAIRQRVAEGKLSHQRIEQSYRRIQQLKARIGVIK